MQNPIAEGDSKWILHCNCEGTEQLRNKEKTGSGFRLRITLESHFAYMDGDDDMKVLVIPDIHLKTWIFDRVEDIIKA